MSDFLGLKYVYPADIELVRDERLERSLGGGMTGTVFGAGRWAVDLTLEPGLAATAKHRLAAHRAKHGSLSSFAVQMPQPAAGVFDSSYTYDVGAAAVVGANQVNLKCSSDVTLPIGRFIKFSNSNKVYQVDGPADYTITSAGVLVSIIPNLVAAVAITHDWDAEPDLTCKYDPNSLGFASINRQGVVTRRISVIEV